MMLRQPKALVVDDDEAIRGLLERFLADECFEVVTAEDGDAALQKFDAERPDIVILDLDMPQRNGLEVCRRIRRDPELSYVPIIAISGRADLFKKASTIRCGADDYITKPFDLEEVLARVERLLGRTAQALAANPLTLLPGNRAIEQTLDARLAGNEAFAVGYADLDTFKAYNDLYGAYAGDEVIKLAARVLVAATARFGGANGFVGHIGGDDFVFVAELENIDELAQLAIRLFDSELQHYYRPEDWERGYVAVPNRAGQTEQVPHVSISIAIATSHRTYHHIAEIFRTTAEIKKFLKTKPGRNYLVDRRR